MNEPIPHLYPPTCMRCGGSRIFFEQHTVTVYEVAGFNEWGVIEYLPDPQVFAGKDRYLCRDCQDDREMTEQELADATLHPEEGGDGSEAPF